MDFYQYDSLADSPGLIRTLSLLTAPNTDDILKCTLNVHELSNAPSYDALSYVWGPQDQKIAIRLNDSRFEIGLNLFQALQGLRRRHGALSLWVDALCIDQSSISERNRQVELMGEIYTRAEQVVVWLGEETDVGDLAFDMVRLWAKKKYDGFQFDEQPKWKNLDEFDANAWQAVTTALTQPWWSRMWVYQEYVLARNVVFMLGAATLQDFHLFAASLAWLNAYDSRAENLLGAQQIKYLLDGLQGSEYLRLVGKRKQLLRSGYLPANDLINLQDSTHERSSTDPRDKIYALLGMDEVHDIHMSVDYSRSIDEVYVDFTTRCIEGRRDLEIIAYGGIAWRSSSTAVDFVRQLPTWVPDFTSSAERDRRFTIEIANADGNTKEDANISIRGRYLTCTGIVISQVSKAIRPNIEDSFRPDPEAYTLPAHSNGRSMIETIFRILTLDFSRPRMEDEPNPERRRQIWEHAIGFSYLYDPSLLPHLFDDTDVLRKVMRDVEQARSDDLYPAHFRGWINQMFSVLSSPSPTIPEPPQEDATSQNQKLTVPTHELTTSQIRWHGLNLPPHVNIRLRNRFLFGTAGGYIGNGPLQTQEGDELCVLFGCSRPMVLRPYADGLYEVIGQCYVYNLMHGEAARWWEEGRLLEKRFKIR